MKHPLFLMHFGKRLEDKLRLGVVLGGCDRWTVTARGVNLSLLMRLLCNRRVSSNPHSHFEMSKSITPT